MSTRKATNFGTPTTYGAAKNQFPGELQRLLAGRDARGTARTEQTPRPASSNVGQSTESAPATNPLVALFGSSNAPSNHVAPNSSEIPGAGLLTIPMTSPVTPPLAGAKQAGLSEALDALRSALQKAGVSTAGWKIEGREIEAYSPNSRYVDRQIQIDFGGGRQEMYSADLVLRNPEIAVGEIRRLIGSAA